LETDPAQSSTGTEPEGETALEDDRVADLIAKRDDQKEG
jgi:hypothetical protein